MRVPTVSGSVIPISDFKQQPSAWMKRIRDHGPVILTQNGRAAAVLLSPEEYDALTDRRAYLEAVRHAIAVSDKESWLSTEEVKARLGLKEND